MKSVLASSIIVLLLAAAPASAADGIIFASDETQDNGAVTLDDSFTGGVAQSDVHDGGGAMVIQMLMPNTASSVTSTPGPFVSRAAVTGGAH